jgi:glycosyltransferase involved in cell wall biosynthesis
LTKNLKLKITDLPIICTIAIPVYNRERLISKAIESAIRQNIENIEILIIDNNSTDKTRNIIKTYKDKRIVFIKNKRNIGLFQNFNECLKKSRGKYIKFLCSDDMLTDESLKKEIEIMEKNENLSMLNSVGMRIDHSGHELGTLGDLFSAGTYNGNAAILTALWLQAEYAKNPFNYPSGVLIRGNSARSICGFDSSFRNAGDLEFFLRLLTKGDLYVSTNIGCKILVHDQQEGKFLSNKLINLLDLYKIYEIYGKIISSRYNFKNIKYKLNGMVFLMMVSKLVKFDISGILTLLGPSNNFYRFSVVNFYFAILIIYARMKLYFFKEKNNPKGLNYDEIRSYYYYENNKEIL